MLVAGAEKSSMAEIASLTDAADKVLTF